MYRNAWIIGLIVGLISMQACVKRDIERNCCSDEAQIVKISDDIYVSIPNAFSPNKDSLNDRFAPIIYIFDQNITVDKITMHINGERFSTPYWTGYLSGDLKEGGFDYRFTIDFSDGSSSQIMDHACSLRPEKKNRCPGDLENCKFEDQIRLRSGEPVYASILEGGEIEYMLNNNCIE